jgi:protein-tyrosine phosphatase
MTAALLLSALGVDREMVLDDYELTARWRRIEDDQELVSEIVKEGLPEQAAIGFLSAPRWAMSDALGVLDETYGGIGAYLSGPAGMDLRSIEDLRSVLTV